MARKSALQKIESRSFGIMQKQAFEQKRNADRIKRLEYWIVGVMRLLIVLLTDIAETYTNFSLQELTKSDTAIRKGIDNEPNADQIDKLKDFVKKFYNPYVTISAE